jgi:hypothetical protein
LSASIFLANKKSTGSRFTEYSCGFLENISAALHVNKNYLKEPAYPYTEHDLMRFLFKLSGRIEVNIRPVIMNDKDPGYTTTIYFGSDTILKYAACLKNGRK